MATPAKDDLGFGPSVLPTTRLPANVTPAISSGPDIDRVDTGKIVAYAIRVRAALKVGERDFSGEICLHEAVMMRRFYEEVGSGSVSLTADWAPGLTRIIPLSQEKLQRELARMLSNFVVPKGNSTLVVPTLFLGTEPAEQLKRLHDVMRRQMEAWAKVVAAAKARVDNMPADERLALAAAFDHITTRELEEIANIADPSRDGVGDIELPAALLPNEPSSTVPAMIAAGQLSPEAAMAQVEAEAQAEDPQQKLVEKLVARAEINQQQALAVATLHELFSGDIPDAELSDAIGSKAKAKLDAVRRALKA